MQVILASKSPRRKQLMELLDIPFDIVVADIVETIDHNNDLNKEIEKLSYLKAFKVFSEHQDALVIGADTIVVVDGKVLGKPKDETEAFNMLKLLENNKHEVITGVSILTKNKKETFSIVSEVYFNPMSEKEIKEYIKTKEPMDKAGAYAIQGIGAKFIKSINGDYYSIMGLPINEIYNRLKNYSI